jgi:hypothetical protein
MKKFFMVLFFSFFITISVFAVDIDMELKNSKIYVYNNKKRELIKTYNLFDKDKKLTNTGAAVLFFLMGTVPGQNVTDYYKNSLVEKWEIFEGSSPHCQVLKNKDYEYIMGKLVEDQFPNTDALNLFKIQQEILNKLKERMVGTTKININSIKPSDLEGVYYKFFNISRAKRNISLWFSQKTKLKDFTGRKTGLRLFHKHNMVPDKETCSSYRCLKFKNINQIPPVVFQAEFWGEKGKNSGRFITCAPVFDLHSSWTDLNFFIDKGCNNEHSDKEQSSKQEFEIVEKEIEENFDNIFMSGSVSFDENIKNDFFDKVEKTISDKVINNKLAIPFIDIKIEICSTTTPLSQSTKNNLGINDNLALSEKRYDDVVKELEKRFQKYKQSGIRYSFSEKNPEDENFYTDGKGVFRTGTCGPLLTGSKPDWATKYEDKNTTSLIFEKNLDWKNKEEVDGDDEDLKQYRRAKIYISYKEEKPILKKTNSESKKGLIRCHKCPSKIRSFFSCHPMRIKGYNCLYLY